MNYKGADQPADSHSLIIAIVTRFLESIISTLATSEASIFYLVSVAEETGLSLVIVGNPEDRFCRVEAQMKERTTKVVTDRGIV